MQDNNNNNKDDRIENLDYFLSILADFLKILDRYLILAIGVGLLLTSVFLVENAHMAERLFDVSSGIAGGGVALCRNNI